MDLYDLIDHELDEIENSSMQLMPRIRVFKFHLDYFTDPNETDFFASSRTLQINESNANNLLALYHYKINYWRESRNCIIKIKLSPRVVAPGWSSRVEWAINPETFARYRDQLSVGGAARQLSGRHLALRPEARPTYGYEPRALDADPRHSKRADHVSF
ncbi:hypothetical protein ACJJTC_011263 [Scirpophaga incertulas]